MRSKCAGDTVLGFKCICFLHSQRASCFVLMWRWLVSPLTFKTQNTDLCCCHLKYQSILYIYVCKLCYSAFYVLYCFLFVLSDLLSFVLFCKKQIVSVSHWIRKLCLWSRVSLLRPLNLSCALKFIWPTYLHV